METTDSIVDMLDKNMSTTRIDSSTEEEILVPRKCAFCKNNVICSVLPTFIGISKVGIIVGIEECPYYTPNKNQQNQQD